MRRLNRHLQVWWAASGEEKKDYHWFGTGLHRCYVRLVLRSDERESRELWAALPGMALSLLFLWPAWRDPVSHSLKPSLLASPSGGPLTWLRAEPGAEWFDAFDAGTPERIAARVAEWLQTR